MLWLDTFRGLQKGETFESLLFRDRVPLTLNGQRVSPSLIERASGLLAAHLPRDIAVGEKRRLIFVLPNATQNLGRFLAVSLLLADFVKRQTGGPPLLTGDLLLVTQHIRNCVSMLRDIALRHRSENLAITEFWPIEVLSQYAPPSDPKPRVYVANPGWSSVFAEHKPFGSVVIDVSHPRTADHLEAILKHPSIVSAPTQILVIPPWETERIRGLAEKGRASDLIWAWDPATVAALEDLLSAKSVSKPSVPGERFVWLADDAPVEDYLIELHSLLVGAMKAGGGRVPAEVLEAWGTYHKLRQLAVPLIVLEEERRVAYQTLTIKDRIQNLEEHNPEARGPVATYLEAQWPSVIKSLKGVYEALLTRKEPAKFYTLASVVQEFLENRMPSDTLRIVAPTIPESNMLVTLLGDLVDSWPEALQSGAVSFTTIKEEPRLIAEGSVQQTVLLGFRSSETRHLDVYPGVPIHVVAYPYEAEIDERIQQRVHSSIESLQENGPRTVVLKQLNLVGNASQDGQSSRDVHLKSTRPQTKRRFEVQRRLQHRHFLDDGLVEPLNLAKLAGQNWFDEITVGTDVASQPSKDRRPIEYCEIVTAQGRYRYPAGRVVDVFRPATEQKERIRAGELVPGMLMVVLVDDPYEDIFQRTLEAIREQRDLPAQMALGLWDHAKPAALTKHGGQRAKLHRALDAQGLSVDYAAVVGWYRTGEDETLAPQRREDFEILAQASGLYPDTTRISATFNCIEHERVERRKCGRKLSSLLAHLAAGKNYEAALKSADAIGTPVEQVAAAVSLQEIESVSRIGKTNISVSGGQLA